MTMEPKLKALDAELQLLVLMHGMTDAFVEKGSDEKIACHQEALRKIVANLRKVHVS